jgi:hypothetical protein
MSPGTTVPGRAPDGGDSRSPGDRESPPSRRGVPGGSSTGPSCEAATCSPRCELARAGPRRKDVPNACTAARAALGTVADAAVRHVRRHGPRGAPYKMRRLDALTRTRCADSTPSRVQDAPTRRPHAYKMRRLDAGPVPPRRDPPVVAPRRPAALYGDRALHPSVTPAGSTRRPPAAPTASSRLGCSIRPGTRVRPLVAPRSDAEVMTTAAGPRPDRHGSRGRDLT